MVVPKQSSIRRIQQQRDFCNKKGKEIKSREEKKVISEEEHKKRVEKLKKLGLIK